MTLPSTIAAFLVISLLTFIAGCHFFGQKCKQSFSSLNQPVSLYEDVNVLPSAMEHLEQGLELKENVAYNIIYHDPAKNNTDIINMHNLSGVSS